jgi:hypothetical protein
MPAAFALGTPESAPSGVPERPISGYALPLARDPGSMGKSEETSPMSDDHVQLPIKLDHVRAAYQTAPVPSLATSGPKAAGALWALQRQRQG